MNDIDVAQAVIDGEITASENGTNWTPIGSGAGFTGKFSGDGHTISGIVIKTTSNYQGLLFGYSTGTIMNVGVIDSSISGKDFVGGICGQNDGTITNCYSTGAVSGTSDYVGGVCGRNEGTITNCYSTGEVSGSRYLGGVCGINYYSTITNCYYDTDFYTGNAIGSVWGTVTNVTGISTADLCGSTLPDGFDSGVWTAGSVSDVTEIVGNFGKITYTFPSLIGVGSAFTLEANVYNFGTNEAPDWQTYTEISTADELIALSNDSTKWGGNYVLTADITLTAPAEAGGSNWTAIGTPTAPFTGKFSGDGHTISGIVINKSGEDYQGLFGYLYRNGTIMNVGVVDSSISGGNYVGGVCGYNMDGTIKNCYSTGAVSGTGTVGGVCGENDSTIKNCYSTGTVSGESRVGGVCGANYDGSIENCYNTGTVSGSSNVGGVCGANNRGSTENCYYLEGCSADGTTFTSTEGTSKTETQFKNGSVCYLLNGSTSTNPVWYQLLETENYPNLDSTNSANRTVYPRTPCTGVFSNTEGQTAEHSFVVDTNDSTKHICENCGETHDAEFTADDTADTISICHGFGTVTLKAPTENLTYDGTEKAAAVEGELTGFDTPKVLYKLRDSAEAAVETAPINAGTYVASITYTDADSNEHSVSVEYTISKAAVTITANSYTIKVGDTLPTFDYKVTGLVNNETLPITVIVSCTAADSNTAGTFPIIVSGAAESTNYTFNYVNGTLTITAKNVQTITAEDVTLTYGDTSKKINAATNGDGTISYSVKTGSDVISVAADGTIKALKSGTATVEITAAETDAYEQATTTVTVTVNKAAVTIKADDKTVYQNAALPTFTYSVTGLANGDKLSFTPVLTCEATTTSTVGTYAITVTIEITEDECYTYTTTNGTLTVKKKSSGGGGGGGYRPTTPTEPNNPSIGGSAKSWSDVAADLGKLTNGSETTIELNGNTTIPADVIKAIADKDSKVTFVINSVFSWVIDGAEITTPVAIDLTLIKTASTKSDTLRGIEGTQFKGNTAQRK